MRVLVASRADPASLNIRDRLLEWGSWMETDHRFRDAPVRQRGDACLVEIEGPSIHDEALSSDLAATEWDIDSVWFLSRHRAQSGEPSLTVHPIGNHDEARFGGKPEALSPAAPRDMGALLRRLRHHRDAADLPHQVTFEATHHGPLMDQPSLFVEIGSDEAWYEDRQSGQVLAAAVHDVLDGEGFLGDASDIMVGIGGGHYMPRVTDKALRGDADFGHMVPAYAIDPERREDAWSVLDRAVDATLESTDVYVHKKGLKGPQRQVVREWLEMRTAQ